ncbi:MAG: DUF2914 domain-containing protein [Nitrosomonas sp.]|nr:DUF2914 domain-containing protein [Nitrosomonas sp.]
MTNTQIKIRIQLDPSAQQAASELSDSGSENNATFPSGSDRVYDRRKLFLAAGVLLLIFMGLIWLVSGMRANDEVSPPPDSPELSSLPEAPAVVQAEHDAALPEPIPPQQEETVPIDSTNAEMVAIVTEPIPPAPEALSTELETGIPSAPIPRPTPAEKSIPSSNETGALETPGTLVPQPIASRIARAQLTSAISQREPVDDIRQISLAGQSSRPIFLFLHLYDLTGETIRVNWFFQDQSVAQVLLPVGNNDWRTYSSKTLNARRLGNWHVTAQDSSDNLLAEFSFEVIP